MFVFGVGPPQAVQSSSFVPFDTGGVELRPHSSEPTTYETRTLCGKGSRLNLLRATKDEFPSSGSLM